jgi:phosphoenolpyruvate carboxylase
VKNNLAPELRNLVKWSVALLGEIIEDELGKKAYQHIEQTRRRMAKIRKSSNAVVAAELNKTYQELKKLKPEDRLSFARSYTLMLELMNACENAFRTHRLQMRTANTEIQKAVSRPCPEAILFVLTAHPTEARSPENISIFHEIQKELANALHSGIPRSQEKMRSLLLLAWHLPIVRHRKPKVQDEAEHIYSILLRDSNLSLLLDLSRSLTPIYIRSWVGGDKDGHTGVNQKTLIDSLQLSRTMLIRYARGQANELKRLVAPLGSKPISAQILVFIKSLPALSRLKAGDAKKLKKSQVALETLIKLYAKEFDPALPAELIRLEELLKNFPGMVVPLELREDSGVLMSDPTGDTLAIGKMLKKIGELSKGHDPCWYARGMIISMCETAEHLRTAKKMIFRQIGNALMPVVPLFEQSKALETSHHVVAEVLKDPTYRKTVQTLWKGVFEVMLGYSDSSKESGVLPSRLAVIDAMLRLDHTCKKYSVRPVFFHGSGGSVDRGGGSVTDQMSGWPRSALNRYKATVQGEMVDRIFSSPEILESQILKIIESASGSHAQERNISTTSAHHPALVSFTKDVKHHYQAAVQSSNFLKVVEAATPYKYLSALKIGSRPAKRAKQASGSLSVNSLRAIPWVLCWTQTRVLFPTWWGVGSAWTELSNAEKRELKNVMMKDHGAFRSYVHALGFTLAKIELPVFEFYLHTSNLDEAEKDHFTKIFRKELSLAWKFFQEITGQADPLWYRPWLGKSIELRASMIHPLNLLEILAQHDRDLALLRVTVTGISSGMLTTG